MRQVKRVHLVYPVGEQIHTPYAIGRKIKECLEKFYTVYTYNYDQGFHAIVPGDADVLIGHWHPNPLTVFRMSAGKKGWKRVIALSPFCPDPTGWQNAFARNIIRYCDVYLAITGNAWMERLQGSPFFHWLPKVRHLDLAVEREDFPFLKVKFNKPGKRKFLYIGHTAWFKNTSYLEEIAERLPDMQFDWFGWGRPLKHVRARGVADFSKREYQKLLQEYDFLLTVGSADANPTTILEAMSWGVIPVCTEESGYKGYESIVNLPLNNVEEAVKTIVNLQMLQESVLKKYQAANNTLLEAHFNWKRFCTQVLAEIESIDSPVLQKISAKHSVELFCSELRSPLFWGRPRNLLKFFVVNLRYLLKSCSSNTAGTA